MDKIYEENKQGLWGRVSDRAYLRWCDLQRSHFGVHLRNEKQQPGEERGWKCLPDFSFMSRPEGREELGVSEDWNVLSKSPHFSSPFFHIDLADFTHSYWLIYLPTAIGHSLGSIYLTLGYILSFVI